MTITFRLGCGFLMVDRGILQAMDCCIFLATLMPEKIPSLETTWASDMVTSRFVANCQYTRGLSQLFGYMMLAVKRATLFMSPWTFSSMVGILQDLIYILVLHTQVSKDVLLAESISMTPRVLTQPAFLARFTQLFPTVVATWTIITYSAVNGCPTT